MDKNNFKKITVITGHYGAGKTNFAVNLALRLRETGKRVSIVDLDIVNPYFRTADFSELFKDRGIELVSSIYANTNLDIPAITFDVERLANEDGYLIIDVGGDEDGAIALGRYAEALALREDLAVLYVLNAFRYVGDGAKECAALVYAIEAASGFKITGIVNNSNLGEETSPDTLASSSDFAERVSETTGVPVVLNCVLGGESADKRDFPVKRLVKAPWEE